MSAAGSAAANRSAPLPANRPALGPDRPLTILHITSPAPVGGLERVVQLLAAGHVADGHQVHVVAVLGPGDDARPFLEPLLDAGVTVHPLALAGRAYLDERRRVRALAAALAPDVVHTHGYRPDVLDAPVARAAGVPTLTTVHGFTGGDARNRVYEWLQRRAFQRFDAVVAVSEPLVALLAARGVRPERIHAIRNAWAPIAPATVVAPAPSREALGVPAGAFHVGWVGRLSKEKGADVLVRALARLGDLPVLVSFVGDGAERARLEALAAAAGVAGRIRWRGLMPGAERLFPTFDAFVLSSRTEGTPMVLFEAMHAGTPIVASRVGGVPDVLGDAGLLVAPDDPAGLAAAIAAVRRDPAAATRRAAAGRVRLAERFGQGPWLRRYETLYRSLSR